ncbi:uncharacterized protein LOC119516834 isoform X3 [Choloepus didactylus]|uniref:uncharacterized protein LOC119516834 isoform X3 n=1 Tax=Choloepus didactylus TaxID=27675 RepID=UPI00189EF6D0|nr:uncharacterized protein LOC119516834 isoform X3 [Choloepus didactylus]
MPPPPPTPLWTASAGRGRLSVPLTGCSCRGDRPQPLPPPRWLDSAAGLQNTLAAAASTLTSARVRPQLADVTAPGTRHPTCALRQAPGATWLRSPMAVGEC